MSDDARTYYTLYGLFLDDWITTFGGQSFHRHLLKDYPNEYCSTTTFSAWASGGVKFIYPHHIKKTYYIEGVIEGEITFGNYIASKVTDYRVTLFKLDSSTMETDLATTGVIITSDSIVANDAVVYHFWIDVYENPKVVGENEKIGLKIEWNIRFPSTPSARLLNGNQETGYNYQDVWVDIPLLGVT